MGFIQDFITGIKLKIDTTSQAARVTLYKTDGTVVDPAVLGFMLPIGGRITAVIGAGSTIWAMRNGATKTIRIKRIRLMFGVDPTAAVASAQQLELVRFSTATPTGGTALTVIKKKTGGAATTVADARQNLAAALGVAGVVFESIFSYFTVARTNAATNETVLDFTGQEPFELAANEGLALRLTVASVIGDWVVGNIQFDEL